MNDIEQLEQLTKEARVEHDKFYQKGVKASGTRLRAKLMEIKKLVDSSRKAVTEHRNAEKQA